ncbi:MAG: aldehyde dehydrogenase family protein [Zhongshania sp.]|uniref:aldehyde dehydrogenase family protein n=1 Tax=Zhongshania sp. TaxID=1971902 RepID=UPI002627B93A|nr:aldehyde dehydrogenase family protein [Zhongshania sp.]MDF1693913.1 aldehyde dehydrogenase family protein [Zhongshania sp.]
MNTLSLDPNLQAAFGTLRRGYADERFPSLKTRVDRLTRLRALLVENETALCAALSADFGYRSADQSSFAEITTTIKSVNYALKNLKFWMQASRRSPDFSLWLSGAKTSTQAFPKGVVGIVSPWNFPINLALSPLVSVLAAGNRALIKPSEFTPASSALLGELIAKYFADTEVAVVCGEAALAQQFVTLPFDHLIYTGGETVARHIMAAAAVNLVPLTLELGGKSPVIVSESANLKKTAQRIAFGKYFNAGQICIAPDYLMIAADRLEEFLNCLGEAVAAMNANAGSVDSVTVINDRHRQRLAGLVADSAAQGARVVSFGDDIGEHAYQLNIVIDAPANTKICSEEIFGPLLLIKTIGNLDEQLSEIRRGGHPLVIYYFGSDDREFKAIAEQTCSGALVKNDVIFQYANDDLPFGGVGRSGMGKYRGLDGFNEFSHTRAIFKSGWLDISGWVTPPYTPQFRILNKIMRKI